MPEQLLKKLARVATQTGLSRSEIIRRAVEEFMERKVRMLKDLKNKHCTEKERLEYLGYGAYEAGRVDMLEEIIDQYLK